MKIYNFMPHNFVLRIVGGGVGICSPTMIQVAVDGAYDFMGGKRSRAMIAYFRLKVLEWLSRISNTVGSRTSTMKSSVLWFVV